MAKIYYQEDCNLNLLKGKKIAIIGYGSQGHAHALNLKESGLDVVVGLYEGSKSWAKAEAQGLQVFTAAEASKQADVIMVLINDEKQAKMYRSSCSKFNCRQNVNVCSWFCYSFQSNCSAKRCRRYNDCTKSTWSYCT